MGTIKKDAEYLKGSSQISFEQAVLVSPQETPSVVEIRKKQVEITLFTHLNACLHLNTLNREEKLEGPN